MRTDRDTILAANPLEAHLNSRGVRLRGSSARKVTNQCAATEHKKDHLCVSVDTEKGLWHCNDCGTGGTIVDWIAAERNITTSEAFKQLAGDQQRSVPATQKPSGSKPRPEIEAVYQYHDAIGNEAYQVVRLKPKSFRQRHWVDGEWVWNMEGVERVLYRLPQVAKADEVWVVEGEKDADALMGLGFVATCNVGGAGKWLEGYTESLAGKRVILCGDNDDAGRKHVELVFDSLAGKAGEVRLVELPKLFKDVSDFISATPNAKETLDSMRDGATPFLKGIRLPVFHVSEMEDAYIRHVGEKNQRGFSLGKWMPCLGRVRDLVPGDLCMVLGATGVGKTAVLSNIAIAAMPLPTLFFQLELSPEVLFERLMCLQMRAGPEQIEGEYARGERPGKSVMNHLFQKLYVCAEPRVTVSDIEAIAFRSELKMGEKPALILVDYVGLIQGKGQSRYDRFSTIAEDLKIMAKALRAIVVCAVQVARKGDDPEVGLHDGKDSGSIENSAGLVIGVWRPERDTLMVRVLKNTRGTTWPEPVPCNYDGAHMRITERSKIDRDDVP